jgi:hypothetical protein
MDVFFSGWAGIFVIESIAGFNFRRTFTSSRQLNSFIENPDDKDEYRDIQRQDKSQTGDKFS